MRSVLRLLPHLVLLMLSFLALGGGCGDIGGTSDESRGPGADASAPRPPPTGGDASAADAGIERDDEGGLADASGPLHPPPPPPPEPDPAILCGNLVADEPSGELDCADVATCGATPVCCVDSEHAGCCAPPVGVVPRIDFASCSARPAGCFAGLEPFGAPTPSTERLADGEALWLGGTAATEGGVLGGSSIDPTGVLELWVSVAVLAGCAEAGRCAETVAAGFTTAEGTGDAVARSLAAVLSLDTQQLLLVEGAEVLARRTLVLEPGARSLRVRLGASGLLSAQVDEAPPLEGHPTRSVRAAVRPVLFGRSANGSAGHLFVRSVEAQASACDRPRAALVGSEPLALRQAGTGAAAGVTIGAIAVFDAGGQRRAIVSDRGLLRAARELADASWEIDLTPAGVLGAGFERPVELAGVLRGPGAGQWQLLVVVDGEDLVAFPGDGEQFDTTSPETITSASSLGVTRLDGPAIAQGPEGRVLAFVVRDGDGRGVVRTASERGGAMALDDDAIAPSELPSAFDRDGVDHPALFVARGLVHVLYAGRRGVTESIGLVRRTSSDTPWLRYAPGPVLEPAGQGWRALGVTRPAPVLRSGGDGTARLDVYFTGTDGVTQALGVASRSLPE